MNITSLLIITKADDTNVASYCTLLLRTGVYSLVMVQAFNNCIGTGAIVIYVIIVLQHNGISDIKTVLLCQINLTVSEKNGLTVIEELETHHTRTIRCNDTPLTNVGFYAQQYLLL